MRMSVWDMDSEESDMSSDKEETPANDITVEQVEAIEAQDTEEMANKRSTFCDQMENRMSHFIAPDGIEEE